MQKLEKDLHYNTKHDPKYNEYEDSSSVMMDPQGKIHVTKDENLVETAKWLLRDFEVIDVWPDSLCLEDRYLTDSKTGLMSFNPDWKEDEDTRREDASDTSDLWKYKWSITDCNTLRYIR